MNTYKSKFVSVIIPTYNAAKYIIEAIESVLKQSYENFEIIVVDDGSNDNTAELISTYKFGSNVLYIQQKNMGVSSARNLGILMSNGDIITFLDADDKLLPTSLEKRIRAFDIFPQASVVFTDYYEEKFIDDLVPFIKGTVRERVIYKDCLEERSGTYILCNEKLHEYFDKNQPSLLWTGAIAIRRTVFDEIGLFNTSLTVSEDTDLWRRSTRAKIVVYVAEPLVCYKSFRGGYNKYEKYYLIQIGELKKQLCSNNFDKDSKKLICKRISNSYLSIAYKKYIPLLDFNTSRKYLLKSIKWWKYNMFAWRNLILCCLPKVVYLKIRTFRRSRLR